MDLICDRCSTEYEFEEALVSARGTTVKCTHCGHLFKVYRTDSTPAHALPRNTTWTVRRSDGSTRELATLLEITQLISEGRFTRDDELSRTGKAWRRLGDVEELEAFFVEADRRGPSRTRERESATRLPAVQADTAPEAPAASAVESTLPNLEPTDPAAMQPLPDLETSQSEPVVPNLGLDDACDEDAQTQQRPLPQHARFNKRRLGRATEHNAPPAWPLARVSATASGTAGSANKGLTRTLARPHPVRSIHTPGPISFPVDHAQPEARSEPRLPLLPVIATVVVLVGFTLYYWPPPSANRPTVLAKASADPSAQFLERGEQMFAAHRSERFEEARTDYIKALAFHEHDARLLCALARIDAVWAQALLFSSLDAAAEPLEHERELERRSQSLAQTKQAKGHAEQAKQYAQAAARLQPGNPETAVALSDALRLMGDLPAARSELARLPRAALNDAESLRVSALLAIDEAHGDLRAGLALASQAVAKDPELIRTRLLLARCAAASGDLATARKQLLEVQKRQPEHAEARAIERSLNRAPEANRVELPIASAGLATPSDAAPVDNGCGETYLTRAQTSLDAGQVSWAKRLFEQALFNCPNSPQAQAGLGYVALEKNKIPLAADHFSAAARAGYDAAWIGLGEAYRRMGRPRDALYAYQSYLSRKPNGDQVSLARAQVAKLSEDSAPGHKLP
jgi:predicted Zn finger-like uncharacterized protein